MNTTHANTSALPSFSDIEMQLFRSSTSPAANASAYVAALGFVQTTPAANVRPFVPDPPSRGNLGCVIESRLLRAA